jgi:hypothetical protein
LEKFPEEVSRISIYKLHTLKSAFVSTTIAGWQQLDMIDTLQEIIDKKSEKFEKYFECKQFWLLIHTVPMSAGSFFQPSEETLNYKFTSKFQCVFFLDSFIKKIYELKIA